MPPCPPVLALLLRPRRCRYGLRLLGVGVVGGGGAEAALEVPQNVQPLLQGNGHCRGIGAGLCVIVKIMDERP